MNILNAVRDQFNSFTTYPKKYTQGDDCGIYFDSMNRVKDRGNIAFHRCLGVRGEAENVHAFHTECIKKWYTERSICPNCAVKIDIRPLYVVTDPNVLAKIKEEREGMLSEFRSMLSDMNSSAWKTLLAYNTLSIAAIAVLYHAAINGDPFYEDDKRLAAVETMDGMFWATASSVAIFVATTSLFAMQGIAASCLGLRKTQTPAEAAADAHRRGELTSLKYLQGLICAGAIATCISKGLGFQHDEEMERGLLAGMGTIATSTLMGLLVGKSQRKNVEDPEAEAIDDGNDAPPLVQLDPEAEDPDNN